MGVCYQMCLELKLYLFRRCRTVHTLTHTGIHVPPIKTAKRKSIFAYPVFPEEASDGIVRCCISF